MVWLFSTDHEWLKRNPLNFHKCWEFVVHWLFPWFPIHLHVRIFPITPPNFKPNGSSLKTRKQTFMNSFLITKWKMKEEGVAQILQFHRHSQARLWDTIILTISFQHGAKKEAEIQTWKVRTLSSMKWTGNDCKCPEKPTN